MQNDIDYLQSLGVSALGTRLRRLFEALNVSVTAVYRSELGFEQRWFGLTLLLAECGPMPVQGAANALGSSHVAVLQVAKAMEANGLLERSNDPTDRRVALLSLSQDGFEIAEQVKRISHRVDRAASALLQEAAPDFINALTGLENALRETPFEQRLDDVVGVEKLPEKKSV